jgi:hypothetical protein
MIGEPWAMCSRSRSNQQKHAQAWKRLVSDFNSNSITVKRDTHMSFCLCKRQSIVLLVGVGKRTSWRLDQEAADRDEMNG